MTDYTKLAENLARNLAPALQADIKIFSQTIDQFCDSPIETMLGCSIFYLSRIVSRGCIPRIVASESARDKLPPLGTGPSDDAYVHLVPQYQFGTYRIDWAVNFQSRWVFVECDGHDFHERTKEQAARDRKKDRDIQTAGIAVLRFTGSEIFRDPLDCALQVFEFLQGRKAA